MIDMCTAKLTFIAPHDAGFESSGDAHALHRSPSADAIRCVGVVKVGRPSEDAHQGI